MSTPVLEVKDLKTYLFLRRGVVKAVDGVSFSVERGQSLGIVGESGCGKTITAMSILRLEPKPAGKIVGGQILLEGEDLVTKSEAVLRKIRGGRISLIMQDPMTSLNPAYTIGNQVGEVLRLHTALKDKKSVTDRVVKTLEQVRISAAASRLGDFPHQMSGGMRQRVVGAMAICSRPSLLIADEPTTSLDVTTQAQYLRLLKEIQQETGVSMIFITHDLGIVVKMCDTVCVMYLGKVIERGKVTDIWADPRHPYTDALMRSVPSIKVKKDRLYSIEGMVPSPLNLPPGCAFEPRCEKAIERCKQEYPPELDLGGGHYVRCWRAEE
jgi:oligopeptide/dipeptide ABC transporter ATP-binding protein